MALTIPPPPTKFQRRRGECMALASERCTQCLGMRQVWRGRRKGEPCGCVLRTIFRICLDEYLAIALSDRTISQVVYKQFGGGRPSRRQPGYSRPREEFVADFELLAKRVLDLQHHYVFRLYFIEGKKYPECCQLLGLDKGNFFHAVYRIEESMGRACRELLPYPLFPPFDYYNLHHLEVRPSSDGRAA